MVWANTKRSIFLFFFLLSPLAGGPMCFAQQQAPDCNNKITDFLRSALPALKKSTEDYPPGTHDSFMDSVCRQFVHLPKNITSNRTITRFLACKNNDDLVKTKAIPQKSDIGKCLPYVKAILKKMYGIDLGPIGPARKSGPALVKNGFNNIYDPKRGPHPGPHPSNRLEVRVYNGGSAFKCPDESAPACGHIEICYLGRCTSDYSSDRPLDLVDKQSGSPQPHVLTGIYVTDKIPINPPTLEVKK